MTNEGDINNASSNGNQPHWHQPTPSKVSHDVDLMVMNSLTRKKEKFITMDGTRHVKWYM